MKTKEEALKQLSHIAGALWWASSNGVFKQVIRPSQTPPPRSPSALGHLHLPGRNCLQHSAAANKSQGLTTKPCHSPPISFAFSVNSATLKTNTASQSSKAPSPQPPNRWEILGGKALNRWEMLEKQCSLANCLSIRATGSPDAKSGTGPDSLEAESREWVKTMILFSLLFRADFCVCVWWWFLGSVTNSVQTACVRRASLRKASAHNTKASFTWWASSHQSARPWRFLCWEGKKKEKKDHT